MSRDVAGRCVLLTGLPRGGTTVACELLNRLPDVRALDEPMDVIGMIRAAEAADAVDAGPRRPVDQAGVDGCETWGPLRSKFVHDEIQSFADRQRSSILERGKAMTKHVDGRVLGAKVSDDRDGKGQVQRLRLAKIGEIAIDRPLTEQFTLAIKHPVAFTALLPILMERFEVFAIVRNPLAVLASWESVPMAVRDGQLGLPSSVAPKISARLGEIEDRLERQLALLEWFYACYAETPPTSVIRYEDVIAGGGAALAPIAQSAAGLGVQLHTRNTAQVYDRSHMLMAGQLLLDRGGPHGHFYSDREIDEVMTAACAREPATPSVQRSIASSSVSSATS
jgi:hypothetical protein